MSTPVIEFVCVAEQHQLPTDALEPVVPAVAGSGYCPAGARDGHDWRVTGGRTLAAVREWLRRPAAT